MTKYNDSINIAQKDKLMMEILRISAKNKRTK